jgi:hypothetical protein
MERLDLVKVLVSCLLLAGCGGGGGSSTTTTSSTAPTTPASVTSSAPTKQPIAANAANTVAITVADGLNNVANFPTTSITVCVPGTSNCQVVNNVLVDSSSYGVRILASALTQISGSLPQTAAPGGGPLAACAQFGLGYTFGSVRTADIKVSGETAGALPIQLIADSNVPNVPSSCVSGMSQNTVDGLDANGILGIGARSQDCGSACTSSGVAGYYYDCTNAASCSSTTAQLSQQVTNPVSRFATDNNGIIVQLPPVDAAGAVSVTGTLIFGIGTQSNNALDSDLVKIVTDSNGQFDATYNGSTVTGFVDTGSNTMYLPDSSLPVCPGDYDAFFCPTAPTTKQVTIAGQDGATSTTVTINSQNAQTLLTSPNYAFNDLTGPASGELDLGVPFFYGRHIAVAISGAATPNGTGPYIAF